MAKKGDDESFTGNRTLAWDMDDMEQAMRDVQQGKRTLRAASVFYSVPRTTLHDRVRGIHAMDSRRGPKPRLSAELERELYDIALEKEDQITKHEFLVVAGEFAAERGMPFSRGTPSMAWYRKFMVRMKKVIEDEKFRPKPKKRKSMNWSPSKRKSTMPRKACVDTEPDSDKSDSESNSDSESEIESSSPPSSSDSEAEPEPVPPPPKKRKKIPIKKSKKIHVHVKLAPKRKRRRKYAPRRRVQQTEQSSDASDIEYDNSADENMAKAIEAIKKEDMTYKKAAEMFQVPRSTLHDHVKKGYTPGTKRGQKPVLSKFLEKELYELATRRIELGLSRVDFLEMAGELAAEHKTPFKNGRPSESWLLKMMKRCGGNDYKGTDSGCATLPKSKTKLTTDSDDSPSKSANAEQSDHPYSVPFYTTEVEVDAHSFPKKNRPNNDLIRTQISSRVKSALEEHLTREEPIPSRIEQLADLAESMSQELAAHRVQIEKDRAERNTAKSVIAELTRIVPKTDHVTKHVIITGDVKDGVYTESRTVQEETMVVNVKEEDTEVISVSPNESDNVDADVQINMDFNSVKEIKSETTEEAKCDCDLQDTGAENAVSYPERPLLMPVTVIQANKPTCASQILAQQQANKVITTSLQPQNDFYFVCDPSESALSQKVKIEEVLRQLRNSGQSIQIAHTTAPEYPPSEPMQYVELKDIAGNSQEAVQYIQVLAPNDGLEEAEPEVIQEVFPEEYLLKNESSQEVQHLLVDSSMIVEDENNVQYVIAEEVPLNDDSVTYVISDEDMMVVQ